MAGVEAAAEEEEAVGQQSMMIQEPLECVVVDVMVVVAVVPFRCYYFVVLVARVCLVEDP